MSNMNDQAKFKVLAQKQLEAAQAWGKRIEARPVKALQAWEIELGFRVADKQKLFSGGN